MHRSCVCLALLILAFANSAAAQLAEDFADRLELRTRRQEASAPPRVAEEKPAEWTVQVGASYVDAQDGRKVFATPFNLKAALGETKAEMRIAGEGYQLIDTDADDRDGLADILFALAYGHKMDGHKLIGEAGFYFPAGGEVGSSNWRQRAGLAYVATFGERLSVGTKGRVVRRSADPAPGVSRFTSTLAGELGVKVGKGSEVSTSLTRSYRSGVGGNTDAGIAYSHELKEGTLSIGYARGLTEGAKNNAFEVSIKRSF